METPTAGDRALALVSGLSASVLGYNLLDNPEGFILAVILDAAVGWMQDFANEVAASIAEAYAILAGVLVDAGAAIASPGVIVGSILLDVIAIVNRTAADAAAAAGPFGVIVVPAVWGVGIVLMVTASVAIYRGYKWVRTVIV